MAERKTSTGRRKKKKGHGTPAPSPRSAEAVAGVKGPELLRRVLLCLVMGIIVARPLVLGEDPGLLLKHLTGTSGVVLILLWLAAGVGWAGWRAWSGEGSWRVSGVEIGLAAVVVLTLVSAFAAASYRHPALLIVWEWLGILVAFCLVRQLFLTPGDNHRLLSAVMATAISISAYGVFQYLVELPAQRRSLQYTPSAGDSGPILAARTVGLLSSPQGQGPMVAASALVPPRSESDQIDWERLREELARKGIFVEANSPELASWAKRIGEDNVFATFAHPNAFAGYVVLLFPAGLIWALATWRRERWSPRTLLVGACAAVIGSALWFSHSRAGILATLMVAGLLGLVFGLQWLNVRKRVILTGSGLALLVLVAVALAWSQEAGNRARRSFGLRLDYWQATWRMITDEHYPLHFWLGVGPGNYGRWYPRYMLETAYEKVSDPHNFALEAWATGGIFGLTALLAALGAFFWRAREGVRNMVAAEVLKPSKTEINVREEGGLERHWEFYLGGMLGLILAFFLWAVSLTEPDSADQILIKGLLAAGRSLVWFAAYTLLEHTPWPGPSKALALTGGVVALLIHLLASGGISYPSLAVILWVTAALVLNALPEKPMAPPLMTAIQRALPLAIVTAVFLFFYYSTYLPVTECTGALNDAKMHYGTYRNIVDDSQAQGLRLVHERGVRPIDPLAYMQTYILKPLERAKDVDKGDVDPVQELAKWYSLRLSYARHSERDDKMEQALRTMRKLDPESKETYWVEFTVRTTLAGLASDDKKKRYEEAARALREAVVRDPTEARLHFQLAEALSKAEDMEGLRMEAREALRLDQVATEPLRKLSGAQRQQIAEWLGEKD